MSRPSFDVLTEPWIPVIRHNGSRDELGIRSTLEQAHEIREIRDPAPIVEFGLYRLLIAFVLDTLIMADRRPEDPLDLKNLMAVGCFDMAMIEKYIEQCGDVFDLFHPERPFMQSKMVKTKPKPLSAMFPATPSGTNVTHWLHANENNFSVSASMGARLLTTIAPFMTAGGAGLSPSINGSPAIYALPVGRNLFETIVLNLPIRNQESGYGTVAWRNNQSPGHDRTQATTVEALTWRPRSIQLVPKSEDGNGIHVSEMKFEKGDSTRLQWIDSNLAYRYTNKKVSPIRMRENRPLWRDAGPLMLVSDSDFGHNDDRISFRRPDVVAHSFSLLDGNQQLLIQFYGMRTDMKMKVFEWVKFTWSVPASLGVSTRLGSIIQLELERAEKAAFFLRVCIRELCPRQGASNNAALGTICDRSERTYWQHLEAQFHPLMDAFATMDPDAPDNPNLIAEAAKEWRDSIRRLASDQFELAAKDMDADGDALQRQVNARTKLNNKLRKVLS